LTFSRIHKLQATYRWPPHLLLIVFFYSSSSFSSLERKKSKENKETPRPDPTWPDPRCCCWRAHLLFSFFLPHRGCIDTTTTTATILLHHCLHCMMINS
jgi:hypothetical protein